MNLFPKNKKTVGKQKTIYLIPLQLKEVVEIVGVERGAQVIGRSFAVVQVRMGRVGLGSESIESTRLMRVL